MATERVNNAVKLARASNPGKEIADPTEADIKAEYIKMAGLIINDDTVGELTERAKHNSFVASTPAVEKMTERAKEAKESEKKHTKKSE
jgi:hypothetical protein